MKIFLSILAVIACIAAWAYIGLLGGGVPQPSFVKLDPPDGFVAEDYQDFAQLSSQGGVTVLDLQEYGRDPYSLYIEEPQVAYFTQYDDTLKQHVYVFVDRNAEIIGTVASETPPFGIGAVMLGIHGYYQVYDNWVSALIPYDVIYEPLTEADMRVLSRESTYFWQLPHDGVTRGDPEYRPKLKTFAMLHDGVWKRASIETEEFFDVKSLPYPEFQAQYDHHLSSSPTSLKSFHDGKYTFRRTHFDRQAYFPRKAASFGSTTGVGRPEHYVGTGYYTLQAGPHTLRFKIDNDTSNGYRTITVKGHDPLDFVILEHQSGGTKRRVFVLSAPD